MVWIDQMHSFPWVLSQMALLISMLLFALREEFWIFRNGTPSVSIVRPGYFDIGDSISSAWASTLCTPTLPQLRESTFFQSRWYYHCLRRSRKLCEGLLWPVLKAARGVLERSGWSPKLSQISIWSANRGFTLANEIAEENKRQNPGTFTKVRPRVGIDHDGGQCEAQAEEHECRKPNQCPSFAFVIPYSEILVAEKTQNSDTDKR